LQRSWGALSKDSKPILYGTYEILPKRFR